MKIRLLGIISWFGFCYIFLVLIKLLLAGSLERFFWHWDAPYYLFTECLMGAVMITLLKRNFDLLSEQSTSANRDFLLLVLAIPLIAAVTTLYIIGVETFYFGKEHSLYNWIVAYLIQFFAQTVVCFSCISYFYVTALVKTKERLAAFQKAQGEMELKLLQQQVDPHFLFNNLNVLSSLIEKDPVAANEFLVKLADLYRYLLHTQNVDMVPVREELAFAQNYLYLLNRRFGTAYEFDWQVPTAKLNGQMIVPAALQGLIENVVKHNAGDSREPLRVKIEMNGDSLSVENDLRVKSNSRQASGTGLQNLIERYAYLTRQPVEIIRNEVAFRVAIPLLKLEK